MFKKFLIGLILVLLIAFGGLSYYVSTIDWNKYKNKITTQIEDITGKRVMINGKISLKFLPTPHLNATDIIIYNSANIGKNEPLAQIKEMVTDLSLFPLIHKRFEIDNMNLVDAKILIEFLNNGKTNWYSQIDDSQSFDFAGVDVAFNSIMLQNSTVHIINKELDMDITLKKLNADITAQSLSGPFRIDGNFIKDETPAGFALNVGTLSESFATSLNLVLTHPSSDSYARFDGSVLSNNSEIQGNFTVESQRPSTFLNTIASQNLLPEKYNYPLAASIELMVNPNQIDLSSFIVKYGDNMAGAGKVLIPLKSSANERKKVEMAFEMTDFDIMPFAAFLSEYLKKFEGNKKPFEPNFEYDVIADVTATRAHYNNETIRNFKISTDFINNVLTIKNLSGLLPGDTDIALSGDVFENEKVLSYDLKVQGLSQDFLKFLEFTGHKPTVYAQSTYRNARASFSVSGNLNQIKILPFDFSFDKIELTGTLGFIRDRRLSVFASLQSENINFDNYLPKGTDEQEKLPLFKKINLFLNNFKFLNDVDVQADLNLKLGIYHKIPFENLVLTFNSNQGNVEIKKLEINQIASARMNMSGNVSNIAFTPTFENFKYAISTNDFPSLINKTALKLPAWPLFLNARDMNLEGTLSGTLENANIEMSSKIDKIASAYNGRLYILDDKTYWRGQFELKAPDFLEFANKINLDYNPANLAASVFNFKADVDGSFANWRAVNMNAFIGANNFTGAFTYKKEGLKPQIKANIDANMFEFDRFIFTPEKKKNKRAVQAEHTFLKKPEWNKTAMNYDTFKKFDLSGKFAIKNLSYLNDDIENVNFIFENKNNLIEIKNLTAQKNSSPINTSLTIDVSAKPKINGSFEINGYPMENVGGSIYNIESAKLGLKAQFEGTAVSIDEFIKTAQANISFEITDANVKGIDIEMMEDDLSRRTHSDNLETFLQTNLSAGHSSFGMIDGEMTLENGKYTIKNALMTSGLASIEWNAGGSMEDWDVKSAFNLIFERIKDDVLPIDFSFEGSLANPKLILNASKLKEKYDTHWAQIEEKRRQEEEKRLKELQARMQNVQTIVDEQISLINEQILPRIERYQSKSFDSRVNSVYESILIQIKDISEKLKEFKGASAQDYDDSKIDEIKLQTEVYAPILPELVTKLDENYIFDLRLHMSADLKNIAGIYENSTEKLTNYQNTLNAYTMRLMQLGSLVTLNDLEEVQTNRKTIETSIQEIADIYKQALKIAETSEDENKIILLDKSRENIGNFNNSAKEKLKTLNDALEKLFTYIQDVVYFEQTGKHKTPQKEEIKEDAKEETKEETKVETKEDVKEEAETAPIQKTVVDKQEDETVLKSENTIETVEQTSESNQAGPIKFKPQEENVQETPEVLQAEPEEIKHQEAPLVQEIPQTEQKVQEQEVVVLPAVPLLVEPADDYASRTLPSGTISLK